MIPYKVYKLQSPSLRSCRSLGDKLRNALSKSNLRDLLALLEEGVDVNMRDQHNKTPLHLVMYWKKDISIVEALLSAGADPNAIDHYGNTPLHAAVQSNSDPAIIKALLNAGADVNMPDAYGRSPLKKSIYKENNTLLLLTLLKAGANVKAEDLVEAVKAKTDPEIINLFIKAGAPINDSNIAIPPISYAVLNGDLIIVKMLIAAGAHLKFKHPDTRCTLLHQAETAEVAQELIKNRLNINRVNNLGETPLHAAVKKDILSVAITLIDAGADVHALVRKKGENCLHLAWSAPMVKMLALHGVDINAYNIRGSTPLHSILQSCNHLSTHLFGHVGNCLRKIEDKFFDRICKCKGGAREMVRCGADVNAIGHNAVGRTVLELAVNLGDPRIVSSMIRRGAKVTWGKLFCLNMFDSTGLQLLIREAVIGNVEGEDLDAYPITEVRQPMKYLISYVDRCKDEIEDMMAKKINCNTTVYHCVVETAPRMKALRLCSHYEVNDDEYNYMFPIYRDKVSARLNKCYRRAGMLDVLEDIEIRVPTADGQGVVSLINDCKLAIAEFLSNKDLFKFLLAMGMKFQKAAVYPKRINC